MPILPRHFTPRAVPLFARDPETDESTAPAAEQPDYTSLDDRIPTMTGDPRAWGGHPTAGQAGTQPGDFARSGISPRPAGRLIVESDRPQPYTGEPAPPPPVEAPPAVSSISPRPSASDADAQSSASVAPVPPEQMYDLAPPISLKGTPSTPSNVPYSPLERLQQEYDQLAATPAKPHGRVRSFFEGLAANVGRQAQAVSEGAARSGRPVDAYGLASIAGAGAGGGMAAGVLPREWANQQRELKMRHMTEQIGAQLKIEREAAQTEQVRAQTGWLTARPGIEEAKSKATAAKQEQSAVLSNLRLLKGTRLDPSNPEHASLLRRAAAAGISIDANSFNDASSNLVSMELVDPEHPEQKRRAFFNRATEEITDAGQSGFVAPVGADGMTETQRRGDAARDRSFYALEHERAVANDLRGQQLEISKGQLTLAGRRFDLSAAQFDNRLGEETRKEAKSANDLAAEAERWQEAANAIGSRTTYIDPETHKEMESKKALNKRDEYAARAASLRRRMIANYGYLFAPDDSKGPQMSTEQLKGLFPSLGGNFSGEATRLGITLTDEGSGQGAVPSSILPRRAAPAARRAAPAAAGRYAGQRMPAANLPAAAQKLGMSEPQAKAYIESQGGRIY
jgi:hypothetical protein